MLEGTLSTANDILVLCPTPMASINLLINKTKGSQGTLVVFLCGISELSKRGTTGEVKREKEGITNRKEDGWDPSTSQACLGM